METELKTYGGLMIDSRLVDYDDLPSHDKSAHKRKPRQPKKRKNSNSKRKASSNGAHS